MFQSVITHCVDPKLRFDELGEPEPLEHWVAAIKDLFRQFGPCDPRWIEARLHGLLTEAAHDKHPFQAPPGQYIRMAEQARVILVGDWFAASPQRCKPDQYSTPTRR
jgi:hypothetical protein